MAESLHGTGEEWRAMDDGALNYKRAPGSDLVVSSAKANIAKLRMREVELRLVDRAGKPAANVAVEAVQTRNAFCFGDQLWGMDRMYRFGEGENDRAFYLKKRFADALNAANALCYWTERPRNDGSKTEDIQGRPRIEYFEKCVDWALSAGLTVKGHPLFWSIDKCVPDWVKRYDYATQMKFAEVRVRNLVARFKGKIKLWDAVNEPMWEPAFKNLSKRNWPHLDPLPDIADYIEQVLRWCREEDPDAIYTVNDYGMEEDKKDHTLRAADGSAVTAARQRQRFLGMLKILSDRGVPPDAVGLQSHTGGWLDHPTQVAVYDEMATSGLPVHITEFWANTGELEREGRLPKDEILALQADYVADYLTVAYGHPAVEAFFFWGFMNSVQWRDDSSSHELTPMYHRVLDLIKHQWMTHEKLTTNGDGVVRFRGFHGDYALRYPLSKGVTRGLTFSVDKHQSMPLTLTASFAG